MTEARHPDRDPLDSDFGPEDVIDEQNNYPDGPGLQIHISQAGLKAAAEVLAQVIPSLPDDAYGEIAGRVIAAALDTPPTVTNRTVEGLTRAMLMAYPTAEAWADANRRQIVLGLLLSLGVETKG